MPEHHTKKRRLSDILAGDTDTIRKQWDETEAAGDFAPLPRGTYIAHVQGADLFNAKTGTPGVKIRFDVCEGEHTGRCLFHDLWLTAAALPQTERSDRNVGVLSDGCAAAGGGNMPESQRELLARDARFELTTFGSGGYLASAHPNVSNTLANSTI